MKAENKWDKEEDYIFLKKWIECNLKTDENLGIDKAIYEKLPKVIMQENKSELIDGEFKHEVRQFEKSYDNQQAEQISLMV